MAKQICKAIAAYGRISLVVSKDTKGYKAFSKVLTAIDKGGCLSWYGDVTDENGKETSGLIITSKVPVQKVCPPKSKGGA